MKKYIYLSILFLFLLLPINVFGIVNPTSNFFVNDYANILSSETEEYIFNKSVKLYDTDGTQIVVVTVPDLDGYSLEEYANRLFNSWEIGDKDNNGLLLLLALEEREFRVEVGDGLGGILPDAKTGRFQDEYIIPHFKNNDWDNGMKNGYDAFFSEIVKLNNLDIEYNNPQTNYYNEDSVTMVDDDFVYFPLLIYAPILIGIFAGTIIRKTKKANRTKWTLGYLGLWLVLLLLFTIIIQLEYMSASLIINLMVFICARFSSGSSTGGYSSRGGSSRSSSSRSFSGGGGRSSGGGSSRRF